MAEINVVPYIDVTLVLLIIFMITTPMLQTAVEVDLPKAQNSKTEKGESDKKITRIVIEIKENETYRIKVDEKDFEQIEREEIEEKVKEAIANNAEHKIYIGADKGVVYDAVIQVFTKLKSAGIENVGLMTEPEGDQ